MNTGEHASTIDVNECDLYTPENCPAPSGISKYRTQFLKALADATPEVLETLREDVFPLVAELGVFDGPDSRSEQTDQILDQHVVSWGKQFNLNDPWLHEAAKLTLHLWHTDPLAADALLWASLPDTPSQILPLIAGEMKFEATVWCVETEAWPQFKKRSANSFDAHLKAYKADITAKLKETNIRQAPKLKKTDHFVWLALYQVRGWSPSKIASHILDEHDKDISDSGILKAVRKKAKLIKLTLRPARKGIGRKQRIVVPDRPRRFGTLPITVNGLRKRPAMSP